MYFRYSLLIACLLNTPLVFAKNADDLQRERERFDENYSELLNSGALSKWKRPFSELPLIIGGTARYQYQNAKLIELEEPNIDYEEKFLQRYSFHLDWYSSDNIRFFTQLNYSDDIKSNVDTSPVDKNDLEFQQYVFQYFDESSDFRLGKQEVVLNKKRIFGSRDGTNLRRTHTALWLQQGIENYNLSLLVGSPTDNNKGSWEDEIDHSEKYYKLGVNQDDWSVDYYFIKDTNPMIGKDTSYRNMVSLYKEQPVGDWEINNQLFVQWGHSKQKDILAWRYVGEAELALAQDKALILTVDAASGGESKNKIKTFDSLYMRGDLLSQLATFTASNLITFHPKLEFEVTPNLEVTIDTTVYWRYSEDDELYAPNRRKAFSTSEWDGNYIGTAFGMEAEYEVNEHTELELSLGKLFLNGDLTDTGLNHASEIELTATFSF